MKYFFKIYIYIYICIYYCIYMCVYIHELAISIDFPETICLTIGFAG